MATPHVAGLAALLLQAKPKATADQLQAAILGSCADPAPESSIGTTRGLPDVVRALDSRDLPMTSNIDPRLDEALETAPPGASIQAILTLVSGDGALLSRERMDELVKSISAHAQASSGKSAKTTRVFYNLQALRVDADAEFVRSALCDAAVSSAMLDAPE